MRSSLLAFLLFTATGSVLAAGPLPQLRVKTADGGSIYRIGERIRLKLSFTSSVAGRYEINEATYDRSGRMSFEGFQVLPDKGWSDPLREYFENRVLFSGGLTGFSGLTTTPFTLDVDLNEWVRFDKPGVYTVKVHSGRVSDLEKHRRGEEKPLELISNSITLRIVPADKEWQERKLAQISGALAATPPQEFSPDSAPRKQAASDLRFLATEGAVDLLTRYYREDQSDVWGQCEMGLLGLPVRLRASAVASLNNRIAESDFPVFGNVLSTVAFLQSKLEQPGPAVEKKDEAESLLSGSPEEMKDEEQAWNLAYQSLNRKTGNARVATLKMLFDWHPENTPREIVQDLNRKMAASLLDLGTTDQQDLLNSSWDVLRSPELVPVLKQMAAPRPEKQGSTKMQAAYQGYPQATALFRWYEIDPAGARDEILRQIGSSHPTLYADAVDFLPSETLPQFETIWADALTRTENEDEQGVLLSLMARFGTGQSVAAVRKAAQGKMGVWPCREQSAALAYLVRFDEAGAPGFVEEAVAARGADKTGCDLSVFTDVAQYVSNPMLVEEAAKALDDSDDEVVLNALQYLQAHGDEAARQSVMQRYIKWSDRWRGHETQLENRQPGDSGYTKQIVIGRALVEALMANQGWIPTDGDLEEVTRYCLGKEVCADAADIREKSTQKPIPISFWDVGQNCQLTLAQFAPKTMELLEDKIKQFPRGTQFHVYQFAEIEVKNKILQQRIVKMLQDAGMEAQ